MHGVVDAVVPERSVARQLQQRAADDDDGKPGQRELQPSTLRLVDDDALAGLRAAVVGRKRRLGARIAEGRGAGSPHVGLDGRSVTSSAEVQLAEPHAPLPARDDLRAAGGRRWRADIAEVRLAERTATCILVRRQVLPVSERRREGVHEGGEVHVAADRRGEMLVAPDGGREVRARSRRARQIVSLVDRGRERRGSGGHRKARAATERGEVDATRSRHRAVQAGRCHRTRPGGRRCPSERGGRCRRTPPGDRRCPSQRGARHCPVAREGLRTEEASPAFHPPSRSERSAGPAAADGRSSPSKRAPPISGIGAGFAAGFAAGGGAGRLGLGGARRGEVGRRRREIDVVVGERRDRRGLRGRRSGLRRGQRRLHRGERLHDRRRRGGHRRQVHQLVNLAERRRRRERDGAWRRGGGLRGGGLGRGRLRRARLLGRRRLREQIVVDVESAWAGRRRGRRGRQDGRGDTHDGVLRHRRRGDRRVRVVHGERVTALRAPHL